MNLHYGATSTWLGIHLELMGNLLLCFSAMLLVALPNSLLSPGRCLNAWLAGCVIGGLAGWLHGFVAGY